MPRRARRPSMTMKDVARAVGVSQATVSLVVNDVEGASISEATKARVWEAVEALGYRPNEVARGLRRSRTNTIGFISDDIATTPFAGAMIQGAQDAAWARGMLLLLVNTGGVPEVEQRAFEVMAERQVDGLIYATMYHRVVRPSWDWHGDRVALLDAEDESGAVWCIVPDEKQGGFSATAHLVARGHRRIGFVNEGADLPAARGRLVGYRRALEAWGLGFEETLVVKCASNAQGGYEGAKALLELAHPPTGLFCFNDRMAMGAYRAAAESGLRIPDDVSVVGFDDLEVIAPWLAPPLTTVALPHYEMGRRAGEHVTGLVDGRAGAEAAQLNLEPCPLIERQSVAPPGHRTERGSG